MSSPSSRRRIRGALAAVPAVAIAASGLLAVTPVSADAAQPAKTPNTAKLAGALAKQKLVWQACDYKDSAADERFGNVPNVQCATVKVPRDWHNPGNGKTWDIRISQAKNQDVGSARYNGTIFVNPGGPGGAGLPWAAAMQERTPDLNPYYNYVGFDPRGVGQSSVPTCDYTFDGNSTDPYAQSKAIGAQCGSNEDIKTINTEQTVYDMDFIRGLLKAPKLSYIGYSYGTWLGTWYENIFAANGDKFLLDSSTDVTEPTFQRTSDLQPLARDRQFKMHLMHWMARHSDVYELGTDPQKIYAEYWSASKKLDPFAVMLAWLYGGGAVAFPNNNQYPVAADTVLQVILAGRAGDQSEGDTSATPAAKADKLLAAVARNGRNAQSRAKATAGRSRLAGLTKLPVTKSTKATGAAAATAEDPLTLTFREPFDMVRCNDGQWTQGAAYWEKWAKKTEIKAPLSAQWGLLDVPVCAFWRTNLTMPVANPATFPKTIVVQGELDSQTAYEAGFATAKGLPNTSAMFIDNEGSHGHFPYGTECLDRPIYNYFLTGKQPKKTTVCQGLPLIGEDTTYETWGKLNAQGKEVPVNGGPFTPAASRPGKGAAETLKMADPALDVQLRNQVRKVYGKRGVAVLDRQGPLN